MTSNAPRFSKGFTFGTQTLETLQLHSKPSLLFTLQSNCIFPQFFISCLFTLPKRKAVCSLFPPHTHALLSPYSHILSYFIDLLELLSTWIRALNIFCSPNHCESRGHFHLGLRRLWPQDFQRLSEVQRPNISSSTALWSILRFHGLYRIDRFLRPDNNLSNIITYRGCCERRSSKEKALTFTSTESKVRKLPFCMMAAK